MPKSKPTYTWDLNPLFKSDDDPQIYQSLDKQKQAIEKFVNIWEPRSDYLSDPKALKQSLDEFEHLMHFYGIYGSAYFYASLRSTQDQSNPVVKALTAKVHDQTIALENSIQFYPLRLAKIPPEIQKQFLKNHSLIDYRHFLQRIFDTAKYDLSEPEERILNLKSKSAYELWVNMVSELLAQEERIILTEDGTRKKKPFEEIGSLLRSNQKQVRDTAFKAQQQVIEKVLPIAEYEINAILYNQKTNCELRKAERPDTFRHVADDIDTKVVDTLISTVTSNYSIPHRYYALKAKLIGLPKLEYYERNVEYGQINLNYSFKEAVQLITKVLTNLDPVFTQFFTQMVNQNQFDVLPHKGKTGGAFCTSNLMIDPTYILLNFTNKLDDVLTIAHETGHAIHAILTQQHQNALNCDCLGETPKSTAEVASTFIEDFVLEHLKENCDDETKLALNMKKLEDDINTIFSQISGYKFEQDLHKSFREKGHLTASQISELFFNRRLEYTGKAVNATEGCETWWVAWWHIRAFFYVYSYASGQLISKVLQEMVRTDHASIEKVKRFLSAGTSKSPQEIFLELGIDISQASFWKAGIQKVKRLLNETTLLAQKLHKI